MLTLTQLKEAIKESDRSTVEEVLADYSEEVLKAALECGISPDDIAEAYQGEHANDREFAYNMADQLGVDLKQDWPLSCIDWDFAAKELMYDYSESNGHYFRNV